MSTGKFDAAFAPSPAQSDDEALDSVVSVNEADIRGDLASISSSVALYGRRYARAIRAMLLAKVRLAETEDAEYLSIRENAETLGDKITEATIKAKMSASPRVREARAALVEAEYAKEIERAACDSLRTKREALTSLVQLARAEMAGGGSSWRGGADELPGSAE